MNEKGGQKSCKETTVKMEAGEDKDPNLIYGKMEGDEESYLRKSC